jgi:hypothetical protein
MLNALDWADRHRNNSSSALREFFRHYDSSPLKHLNNQALSKSRRTLSGAIQAPICCIEGPTVGNHRTRFLWIVTGAQVDLW